MYFIIFQKMLFIYLIHSNNNNKQNMYYDFMFEFFNS